MRNILSLFANKPLRPLLRPVLHGLDRSQKLLGDGRDRVAVVRALDQARVAKVLQARVEDARARSSGGLLQAAERARAFAQLLEKPKGPAAA